MITMKRVHITVKGNNVQRCGFRNSASKTARELKLKGNAIYVDKSIEIDVEGSDDSINMFIEWCKKGPAHCQIEGVETAELPVYGFTNFEVIHGVYSSTDAFNIITEAVA